MKNQCLREFCKGCNISKRKKTQKAHKKKNVYKFTGKGIVSLLQ